jgi:protein involved in polysaccharide export with SLBB domain
LDDLLTQKLGERLVKPEVTIIHTNPMEPMVYVYGDVRAVQPVPLRMARTLAQAIAIAGGVTRDAALRDVALIRLNEDGHLKMISLKNEVGGQLGPYLAYQNTPLQPDDLILVPESARSIAGRFITDFITEPLSAVNMILTPYFQFKLISNINN